MSILSNVAHLEQQLFSNSIASSIRSHQDASDSPFARFPSSFSHKQTNIGNPVSTGHYASQDDPEDIMTSVSSLDTLAENINHKFFVENGYYSKVNALKSCSRTGYTSRCEDNHLHSVGTSCGNFWCVYCGINNSFIHQRRVQRAFDKVVTPVYQKDLVASYIVTTTNPSLNDWLTYSTSNPEGQTTNHKLQQKRLKKHRKLIVDGIIQYYKESKGDDSIYNYGISSYHFFGDEFLDAQSYIDTINRGRVLDAKQESRDVDYFNFDDLQQQVENGEVTSILQEYEDKNGDVQTTRRYESPKAHKLNVHTNNFFLHDNKGDAYLPTTGGLRAFLTDLVKEDLVKQQNEGVFVPDEVINQASVNFHKQYFSKDKVIQLKHSLNYALRPTVGAYRFSQLENRTKHYLMNTLKGFHNTVYYGDANGRNFSQFAQDLGLELHEKESCTCTVCDKPLVVDMNLITKGKLTTDFDGTEIDTRESKLIPSRVGSGVYKTIDVTNSRSLSDDLQQDFDDVDLDEYGVAEIAVKASVEHITENEDPLLRFDEDVYLDVLKLKPIIDEDGNLIKYEYRRSNWKLHVNHIWEKLKNDMNKILHSFVMNGLLFHQLVPLIIDLHLEFLLDVKARMSFEDVKGIVTLKEVA